MGKKAKKSAMLRLMEKEERMVKSEVSEFYPDGVRANMNHPSDQDPFAQIISAVENRENQPTPVLTEEQMQENCFQIRNNVKDCKANNMEINFVEGVLRYKGNKYELGSTVIKAVTQGASKAVYLHLKKGDAVNSLVFIGGDNWQAFLVTKDDNKTEFIKLEEFHLLSISENSTPEREIGLMVSYLWLTKEDYFSIIMGYNLDPIKNLLLVDELRMENDKDQKPMIKEEVNTNEHGKEN